MGFEPGVYVEIEFEHVHWCHVGSQRVVIGRCGQKEKLGPVVYAAALDEAGLYHKRRPHVERAFGITESQAVAALFNLIR
jgi:hypothetical protein